MSEFSIYIIDDDDNSLFIAGAMLDFVNKETNGLTHKSFNSSIEFYSLISTGQIPQPDFYIIDINMPGLTGFELVDKIVELPTYNSDITIYINSTSTRESDLELISKSPYISGKFDKHPSKQALEKVITELKANKNLVEK